MRVALRSGGRAVAVEGYGESSANGMVAVSEAQVESQGSATIGTTLSTSGRPASRARKRNLQVAGAVVAAMLVLAVVGDVGGVPRPGVRANLSHSKHASRAPAGTTVVSLASNPTFGWARADGAESYDVRFYRDGVTIFRARTNDRRLVLPAEWTYGGRLHRLRPGVYSWTVWPLVSSGGHLRRAAPLIQATFDVSA